MLFYYIIKLMIQENFKLPIYYNNDKIQLSTNICKDLELVNMSLNNNTTEDINQLNNNNNNNNETYLPMYHYTFNNTLNNTFSIEIIDQISKYYTTDIFFLKDTQNLIKTLNVNLYNVNNTSDDTLINTQINYDDIINTWNEIKHDDGFKEKYYYIDNQYLDFLNTSEKFLQVTSLYNLSSPVISMIMPIIILLCPFFILQYQNIKFTISEYYNIFKKVVKYNAIGKLLTEFNNESSNKSYLIISAIFYIFTSYQNIITYIKFKTNITTIYDHFNKIQLYLKYSLLKMNTFLNSSNSLQTYSEFNTNLQINIEILTKFQNKTSLLSRNFSMKKITEIGKVFKYFYKLYNDKIYEDAFLYSFGFNGYIDCLSGIKQNIEKNHLHFTSFIHSTSNKLSKKSKKSKKQKMNIKNNYYCVLKNNNPIKNNINLNKNIIITGPNASGKTTVLKSIMINLILSQQFGVGFFDKATIKPFDMFHCYLNIPDTGGRDSLFQAEARRCKEIIELTNNNTSKTHLCIFDELFSGTNPDDAIINATSLLNYLIKNKLLYCALSTHFIEICEKMSDNKNIQNVKMKSLKSLTSDKIIHTYKLQNGISTIKGGLNILSTMKYPIEIINDSKCQYKN
jgi:hypothetical protein